MQREGTENTEQMKRLLRSGRLEIVGGGYVQNDEASPDFEMVIRQIETGHRYLHKEFGIERVRVAWQIDPFGHSALQPKVLSGFGYEYLVGNRIDEDFKVTAI